MKKSSILQNIGLNEHEQKIYVFLLSKGKASPSDIENKAKMHRPVVYSSLESLAEKGLVSVSPKGKRKLYIPESPAKLEEVFSKIENDFYSKVEDLHDLYKKGQENRPTVSYNEGKRAIADSYLDIPKTLSKDDEYYRYASVDSFNRERFLPKNYRSLRDKKGLERLIITNKSSKKDKKRLESQVKIMPEELNLFELNLGQTIYGNKVAITDYQSQSVITIEHQKFAEFQKKLFKFIFKNLKE